LDIKCSQLSKPTAKGEIYRICTHQTFHCQTAVLYNANMFTKLNMILVSLNEMKGDCFLCSNNTHTKKTV